MDVKTVDDAIRALRVLVNVPHWGCEDCWYSCPKHLDYYGPGEDGHCDCGADRIREIAQSVINFLQEGGEHVAAG